MTWNGQFCPIRYFLDLFPPKWPGMTRNDKFWLICNFLVFRYNSEDLWCSIAYFRKGVKIYQSTCRCTSPPAPPPRNEKVEISGQCDILVLMISWASQWTRTPSATPPAKNVKCLFLDYVQLLMIGQVIQVMKVDKNVKKSHVLPVRVFCCFS